MARPNIMLRARMNHLALHEECLRCTRGERFVILDKSLGVPNWFFVVNKYGDVGYIPSSVVAFLKGLTPEKEKSKTLKFIDGVIERLQEGEEANNFLTEGKSALLRTLFKQRLLLVVNEYTFMISNSNWTNTKKHIQNRHNRATYTLADFSPSMTSLDLNSRSGREYLMRRFFSDLKYSVRDENIKLESPIYDNIAGFICGHNEVSESFAKSDSRVEKEHATPDVQKKTNTEITKSFYKRDSYAEEKHIASDFQKNSNTEITKSSDKKDSCFEEKHTASYIQKNSNTEITKSFDKKDSCVEEKHIEFDIQKKSNAYTSFNHINVINGESWLQHILLEVDDFTKNDDCMYYEWLKGLMKWLKGYPVEELAGLKQETKYELVKKLLLFYLKENRPRFLFILLRIFGALSMLDLNCGCQLITSFLPLSLIQSLKQTDVDFTAYKFAASVLARILSVSTTFPPLVQKALDKNLITYLVHVIDNPSCGDSKLADITENLLRAAFQNTGVLAIAKTILHEIQVSERVFLLFSQFEDSFINYDRYEIPVKRSNSFRVPKYQSLHTDTPRMNKSQLTFSQAEVQSSRQNSFLNENNIMRCFENAPNTFSPNRFLNMYEQKNRIVDNADDEHMRSFGGNTGESKARNESKVMKLEDHSPVSLNKHICCSDVGSSENELSQFFGNHSFQYDDVYRVASPVLCNNSLTYTQHKNQGFLGQGNIENNNISFSKIARNLISHTKEVRTFDNNPLEIFIDSQPEFRARAIKSPILTKNSKHKNTVPYESERDIPVTDISSDISIYKQYKKTSNNSCKKLDLNIESDTDESRSAVKHVNLTESFDCNRSKLGHLLEDIFSHNADSNNHYDPNKKQLGKSSQIVDSDTDRVYKVNEDKRACFIESEKLSKDSLIDPNKRFKRGQDRIHLNIGESFNLVDAYRNNGQRDNQGCFYTLKDSQSISEDVPQFTELSPVSKERLNQCVAQREIQSHFNSTKHTFGANQINSKQIIQNDKYKQRSQSDTVQKMKKSALTTKVWFNENDLSSTQRLIQHNLNSVHQNNQDNSNSYLKCFHDNPEKANHHWQCVFKSPFGIKPNGKVNAQKTSQSVSDLTDSAIRINSNGTYDYNVAKQLNPYSLSSVQNFSNIGQIYDYIIQYGSEKSHKHINSTVVQGFISEGLFNTVGIIQEDMKPAKTFEKYNKYGTSSTIPDDFENIKQVIEGRTDVTQVSQYNPDTEQQVLQHDLQNQQKTVEKDLNKIEQVIQDTSNKAQFSQDDSQNNKQGLIQDGLDSEQGVAQDDLDSEQGVVQDDSVGTQNLLQDYSELIQKHLDSKQGISVKKQEVSQDYSDDKQNIIQGCLVGKQEIFRGDSFDKQNTIQDRSDSKHEVIQDDSCDKQKAILYHLYSKQDIFQDKSYDKQEDILCHLDKFRHEAIQTDIRRPQHAVHNCFKKSKLTIQDSLNHAGKVSQNNLDVAEIIIQVNKRAAKPFARDALEDEKQVSENVLSDEKDLQTLVERLQEAYHRDDTTMVVKYGRKLLQLLQELKTEADDEKIKSLETPEFISLLLDVIEFSDIEGDGQVTDIYIKLLLVLYHLRRPSCVILESIRLRETAVTFTSRLTTLFKYYVADKMEDSGGQQLLLLLNDIFSSDVCKMFLYTEVKTLLAETSGHLDKGCNCYTNTCAFAMFRNKLLNCINMYWSA